MGRVCDPEGNRGGTPAGREAVGRRARGGRLGGDALTGRPRKAATGRGGFAGGDAGPGRAATAASRGIGVATGGHRPSFRRRRPRRPPDRHQGGPAGSGMAAGGVHGARTLSRRLLTVGFRGQFGPRRTPTIVISAANATLFAESRSHGWIRIGETKARAYVLGGKSPARQPPGGSAFPGVEPTCGRSSQIVSDYMPARVMIPAELPGADLGTAAIRLRCTRVRSSRREQGD